MDADELLKRYAAGERDFREVNLIGASLSEAFLSHICLAQVDTNHFSVC